MLKQNILDKLEDARLRGTDAQLLGVREIRLQVNAGPRLLARQGYQGYGYVETPESLAAKSLRDQHPEQGPPLHPVLPGRLQHVAEGQAPDRTRTRPTTTSAWFPG
jgi:hypothetical protein